MKLNPWFRGYGVAALPLLLCLGCATMGPPRPVGPEDIPALQERTTRNPNDGEAHLLLAAAQAEAGRCEEALVSARRGRFLLPADATGPLIIGQCLEEAGQFGEALNLYAQFLLEHGDSPGAQAVGGRRIETLHRQARQAARDAVRNEESLAPADPETVGVLPFIVDGDSTYQALSVGLAHMLTTDLALLGRFPLVERVQLGALLEELELPPELLDPATAVRAGRLVRASRMILGTASIPAEGQTRLGGNVVLETGEMVEPQATEGELNQILSLEKELAFRIAGSLGYELSQAERQRILQNQPASLMAFLAFSRGLLAEDRGDYEAAAAFYSAAAEADPGYGEALNRQESVAGVAMIPIQLAQLTMFPGAGLPVLDEPMMSSLANTLASSIMDVASHQPERATLEAGSVNTIVDVLPEADDILPLLEAVISIMITIPR